MGLRAATSFEVGRTWGLFDLLPLLLLPSSDVHLLLNP